MFYVKYRDSVMTVDDPQILLQRHQNLKYIYTVKEYVFENVDVKGMHMKMSWGYKINIESNYIF